MKVAVVGAGLGGLSAAAHLAGAGHDVTVFERSSRPGGRAGLVDNTRGYVLDNGPSVLTMPELLDDVFASVGATLAEHVELRPVDPMYRACFADGSELRVWHDRHRLLDEIGRLAGGHDAAGVERFFGWLARLYAVEMPSFVERNYDSAFDLVRPLLPALRLLRLGGFARLDRTVASFVRDERVRRLFTFQSMYAGLAPYEALALYAVITYMDCVRGVFAPRGGVHRVVAALAEVLRAAGVVLHHGATVTRVLLTHGTHGAVCGVDVAGGGRMPFDAVVCNADLPVAYRTLVPDLAAPRAARRGRYSPSCLLWVAGVRGAAPPGAAQHNLHFGAAWDGAFRSLMGGECMDDPSILVTMHSLGDATLAPPRCSTLYALEPVPNLDGRVDWTAHRERATGRLREHVARLGYPVEVDGDAEAVVDPIGWEATGLARGTPFSLAHTFFQTGPFRPSNVARQAPGLVFTGSSTLPGVGVPMVLVSGKLAALRVADYERARR